MSASPTELAEPIETFPFVIARATVQRVELVSASFVRVEFAGPDFASFGTPGQTYDQRIKLIFPPESGVLPDLAAAGGDWYQAWLEIPEADRGAMRTYSVRDLRVDDAGETTLVVDFVLHVAPGASGPASNWAAQAKPGDTLLIFGPRRGLLEGGGIEYAPGAATTVLLAGDETAAPAIARIIEDLASATDAPRVHAFIEVPETGDRPTIAAYEGCEVHWLPRAGVGTGKALIPAVLRHLGALSDGDLTETGSVEIVDVAGEELVWETPQFSRLGEQPSLGKNHAETYFWIAGESGTVTTLRRHLVRDLGIDRTQVAFMGYWRRGVAMRG